MPDCAVQPAGFVSSGAAELFSAAELSEALLASFAAAAASAAAAAECAAAAAACCAAAFACDCEVFRAASSAAMNSGRIAEVPMNVPASHAVHPNASVPAANDAGMESAARRGRITAGVAANPISESAPRMMSAAPACSVAAAAMPIDNEFSAHSLHWISS